MEFLAEELLRLVARHATARIEEGVAPDKYPGRSRCRSLQCRAAGCRNARVFKNVGSVLLCNSGVGGLELRSQGRDTDIDLQFEAIQKVSSAIEGQPGDIKMQKSM